MQRPALARLSWRQTGAIAVSAAVLLCAAAAVYWQATSVEPARARCRDLYAQAPTARDTAIVDRVPMGQRLGPPVNCGFIRATEAGAPDFGS